MGGPKHQTAARSIQETGKRSNTLGTHTQTVSATNAGNDGGKTGDPVDVLNFARETISDVRGGGASKAGKWPW